MGWFNGKFFVSAQEIKEGAVPVETELDENSHNPIANKAVAALKKLLFPDDHLDVVSEKPVQNRIITEELQNLFERNKVAAEGIADLESAFDAARNQIGTNLLNINTITPDHYLDGDGELDWGDGTDETQAYALTAEIPVTVGDVLTYQRRNPTTGERENATASCEWVKNGTEFMTAENNTIVIDEETQFVQAYIPNNGNDIEPAIVNTAEVVPFKPYFVYTLKPECLPGGIGADGAVLYTPQELTEEQKAQARENIGAVAEEETFDRAIGEITVGKNLLNLNAPMPDPDDVYSGGFLRGKLFNDAGEIAGNSAACITDYISVQDGKYFVCSYNNGTRRAYMMARRTMGYDADKNLIGLLSSSTNYVTPAKLAGVAYVRLQLVVANVDAEGQVEYNDNETYTAYEPYNETVIAGGLTIKPKCMPAEFGKMTERLITLEDGASVATLAIDKARFDGRFNYVAYSAINGIGKDQNSREFFLWAAKKEFTALKGDIEVTADGKLVMCHDEGFTFDDAGLVTTYSSSNATAIHDLTEAECLALQYARYSGYVCGFEEYIRICKKYGKIAYITIRNHFVDECVPELLRVLSKYGMIKQCIISGYPSNTPLTAVREADTTIMLAWVLGKNADITTEHIDYAISLGNMLICGFNFTSASDDVATKLAGSLAAIEYAHANDIRVYEGQVHSMEIADKLMEYGITGAQIMFNPSFE